MQPIPMFAIVTIHSDTASLQYYRTLSNSAGDIKTISTRIYLKTQAITEPQQA